MKPFGANSSAVMSSPVAVEGLQVGAAKGRQEHGEVERQAALRAVELLVVDDAGVDPLDVGSQDGPHAALAKERLGPHLAGGLEAVLGEGHAPHAEVAEFVLVGEVDDVGQVAHAALREVRVRR